MPLPLLRAMTVLPIPTGPTNREIIDRAYQIIGVSDAMFERTPEEYASAILPLGSLMLEYPYNTLGYVYENEAGLRVEEETGITRASLDTVAYGLAKRIAPTINKTLSAEASSEAARLYTLLLSTAAVVPSMPLGHATPSGAGNRRIGVTYFNDDDSVTVDIGTLD